MMRTYKIKIVRALVACVALFTSNLTFAQEEETRFTNDVNQCVDAILNGEAGDIVGSFVLGRVINISTLGKLSGEKCDFKITGDLETLREKVGELAIGGDDFVSLSLEVKSLNNSLNEDFSTWMKRFQKKTSDRLSSKQDIYLGRMNFALDNMRLRNLYSPEKLQSGVHEKSPFLIDTLEFEGPDKFQDCKKNSDCAIYLEHFIAHTVFSHYWASYKIPASIKFLKKTRSLNMKQEHYLLQSGGMYPWELMLNDKIFKTKEFLQVPQLKIHLLHPSPIVGYDRQAKELTPSVMLEVLGLTKLNYSEGGKSFPVGVSGAVDFKNDKIRYGAVVHLPLKALIGELHQGFADTVIPCDVCSIAFLTDGHNGWSVGLKINAAPLFFSKEKASKYFSKFGR